VARERGGGRRACSRAQQRGGALFSGSMEASRWQGVVGELAGATVRAPGKAVGGGAHPNGGAAWRLWRSLRTAVFTGGEGASVASGDGGAAL
jgi:hypothetical protein